MSADGKLLSVKLRKLGVSLHEILSSVIKVWPQHEDFLEKSFRDRSESEIQSTEFLSQLILKIAGTEISRFAEDYQWMCDRILEEELHFRRTKQYRFSHFKDVESFCYGDPTYMGRYMNGVLLSQVLWINHFRSIDFYNRVFLTRSPHQYSQLEIGPGHGLLTGLSAMDSNSRAVAGWDVSSTSLEKTRGCLERMGVDPAKIKLRLQDVVEIEDKREVFDNIVLSEVLEHLENPNLILKKLKSLLKENGRLFVNVPINSPAPDHIYLLKDRIQAEALLTSAGFRILQSAFFPMTGYSLERAQKMSATISAVFIAGPL